MEFGKAKKLLKEISDCSEKILKKFVATFDFEIPLDVGNSGHISGGK